MNEISLILDDVAVSRGVGPVVSGVSLTLEPGRIIALVGPNGAGKTSLIESISGVTPNSAGQILLGDRRIDRLTRVERARLGISHIEQGRAVFPSLTVRENLSLTARTNAAIEATVAQFPELEKRLDSAAGLLSGGEQQMVVLARAFAASPKFLLIDEMSLGLAPVVFMRLLPMIQSIAERGTGVLLVEQFTELALSVSDEALVVASGVVSYQGSVEALEADPDLLHRAYLGAGK